MYTRQKLEIDGKTVYVVSWQVEVEVEGVTQACFAAKFENKRHPVVSGYKNPVEAVYALITL